MELAERLGITKNAFSMLKRRKSLGTLIEKFIEKEIIVSFDQMVYEVEYDLKRGSKFFGNSTQHT